MTINRRTFTIQSILGTAGLVVMDVTQAQAPMLVETSPQASALGYRADASKVEKASFPNYAPGQKCSSCQMFRAKESTTTPGSCAIFPGKLVSGEGWCNAYVKIA
jgi:High potential iron-sulfur protein